MDEAVELGPGYHLVVSRLLPYKNVDQVVEAFRGLPERLLVIGAGPLLEELRAAAPDNVRFATGLTDAQMRCAHARATALVAANRSASWDSQVITKHVDAFSPNHFAERLRAATPWLPQWPA